MLNILWPFFIIISIFYAILSGNIENINNCIFESAENAVKLTLTLLGATCLWSGIMEIASKTDIIKYLSAILQPIIKKIFYNTSSINCYSSCFNKSNKYTKYYNGKIISKRIFRICVHIF